MTQFEYSAEEERLVHRDEDDGITRHFIADFYERELNTVDSTIEQRFHLFAGGRAIGEIVRKGSIDQTLYFHTDHLGSVDTLSDSDGNSFQQHFDPFGSTVDGPSPALTRAGFTGHKSEVDLGLIDMKGRYWAAHGESGHGARATTWCEYRPQYSRGVDCSGPVSEQSLSALVVVPRTSKTVRPVGL